MVMKGEMVMGGEMTKGKNFMGGNEKNGMGGGNGYGGEMTRHRILLMLCILYVYLPVLSNLFVYCKALWSTGHMVVRALYKCYKCYKCYKSYYYYYYYFMGFTFYGLQRL